MKRLHLAILMTAIGLTPLADAWAGLATTFRPIFMVRIYTSEVPSAVTEEGQYIRIGVIIPPGSKVVKVEAFMDDENFGRSIDKWQSCDFETGECELQDARVDRLIRWNNEEDITVTADFWNMHQSDPRFAKLKVTFLPVGNTRKIYKPKECWLQTECGFAGWMDQAYEEEKPVDTGS